MAVAYTIFVEPEVHSSRRLLPGHVRQRIARLISEFASVPRPTNSQRMVYDGTELPVGVELRRLRLEQWRLIYDDLPEIIQRLQ